MKRIFALTLLLCLILLSGHATASSYDLSDYSREDLEALLFEARLQLLIKELSANPTPIYKDEDFDIYFVSLDDTTDDMFVYLNILFSSKAKEMAFLDFISCDINGNLSALYFPAYTNGSFRTNSLCRIHLFRTQYERYLQEGSNAFILSLLYNSTAPRRIEFITSPFNYPFESQQSETIEPTLSDESIENTLLSSCSLGDLQSIVNAAQHQLLTYQSDGNLIYEDDDIAIYYSSVSQDNEQVLFEFYAQNKLPFDIDVRIASVMANNISFSSTFRIATSAQSISSLQHSVDREQFDQYPIESLESIALTFGWAPYGEEWSDVPFLFSDTFILPQ